MKKLPISVHILTFNNEGCIEDALKSVAEHCEEILVVDGGSTDTTIDIAKLYGARVIDQDSSETGPIKDFSAVRNHALASTKYKWILSLDSDEIIAPKMWEEVEKIVETEKPVACLVPRHYVLPDNRVIDHATTYPNERLYFFHRDVIKKWVKSVHERPELKSDAVVKRLPWGSFGMLSSIEVFKQKCALYLEIEKKKEEGKGWDHWLKHRLWHTTRSRLILFVKLILLWSIPRKGVRMPIRYELMRYWYGWKLIVATCPLSRKRHP
jgi:glycosyltransferase involved in cell wall biosynthesis